MLPADRTSPKDLNEDAALAVLALSAASAAEGLPEDASTTAKEAARKVLSERYGLPSRAYDERLPVPPELLAGLPAAVFSEGRWFPVTIAGGTVVVAAVDPSDPAVRAAVAAAYPGREVSWRVALALDLRRMGANFAPKRDGFPVGVTRTGLARWRNTMAEWRTHLACWRTDMATGRTCLNSLRLGLGLTALGDTLMRKHHHAHLALDWACLAVGLVLAAASAYGYIRLRISRFRPPKVQTLVEVTSAALQFLEGYHALNVPEKTGASDKCTMLGRLGDWLATYSTIIPGASGASERIHLARERNVLAAQRTVCACYRTIAARARTGLAFLRTGVAVLSLGLGLMEYFGLSVFTILDSLLVAAGLAMMVDGLIWYWPVRKEPANTPRCLDLEPCEPS